MSDRGPCHKTRRFSPSILLFALATWFLSPVAPAARAAVEARASDETAPRPNIIFLLSDDVRYDALGAAGNTIIETPHLDRLAAEGTLFTEAFCTTSICATNRASILTGQYARRHGVHDFRTPLAAEQFAQSFPGLLRKGGYQLGFVGKWGVGGALPKDRYDFWRGFAGQGRYFAKPDAPHLTHQLGDAAIEFLDGASPKRPFCLQVSFKAAHVQDSDPWPFQPDPRYESLYRDVIIPRPVTATEAAFKALPEFLQTSEGRRRWQNRFADEAMFQKSVKDYYRLISGVDDVVGRIVRRLRERNLADNTVIIYTSDHGFFLGEHGLAGKWFMYEESIRIPLLIYDPRSPDALRGRRAGETVLSIDVAPTILALAGIEPPAAMQGESLVPLVRGQKPPWRDAFFYEHLFEHPRIAKSEGVRTPRWKYVRYVELEPVYEQLFDLANDPRELVNLVGDERYSLRLEEMRRRWGEWRKDVE